MSNKKGHRVANHVKADIIRHLKEEGISVAQATKDHSIRETTIYGWLDTVTAGAPSWAEFSRLQKQNRELFEGGGGRAHQKALPGTKMSGSITHTACGYSYRQRDWSNDRPNGL